jgi:hypothetical protein
LFVVSRPVGIVCLCVVFLHLKCERCVQAIFEYEETLRLHLVKAKNESFCAYLNTPLVCKDCKKKTLKQSRKGY